MSRTDHGVAQTQEFQCTKIAVPQAIALVWHLFVYVLYYAKQYCNSGLNVVEVAHDMQHQVSHYVTSDLGLKNCFDTWHDKYKYAVIIKYTVQNCFLQGPRICQSVSRRLLRVELETRD